jgi:hypothetical protein
MVLEVREIILILKVFFDHEPMKEMDNEGGICRRRGKLENF